jgi:hypothetical protein
VLNPRRITLDSISQLDEASLTTRITDVEKKEKVIKDFIYKKASI